MGTDLRAHCPGQLVVSGARDAIGRLGATARARGAKRLLPLNVGGPFHFRWVETLQRLSELGCDRFLEVGPGQVLSGLVRRTLPQASVASFASMADLASARLLLEVAVG